MDARDHGNAPGRIGEEGRGLLLVGLAAVVWSFGGTIARAIGVADDWTVVFWRAVWAGAFLLGFLLWRDGGRGTLRLVAGIRLPGLGVALCFTTASTAFILALAHTTVANILLMQAGVPLIAALIGWALFRECVAGPTWLAIAAVIAGVGIMVSDSLGGRVSPVGDGLAALIAVALASATVITRRHAHVRMVPAVFLGTLISAAVAAALAGGFAVGVRDMGLLATFGALNLGLGLALFVTGARLAPAALTALVGTLEPVLGPVWVWLVHAEVPSGRTVAGGAIIIGALLAHLLWQAMRRR
ncbi:MAG: DMT family transporter [Thermohalobaculum sp.]|nr:DMT family transporter [Thermohalobaculum sp.]